MHWLHDFWLWWDTDRLSAAIAAGALLIGTITASFAWSALRQARSDSQERSRPVVVAELRDVAFVREAQVLVIVNYGTSLARNVRVTFDPPLTQTDNELSGAYYLARRYANPIPVLSPGALLDNIYHFGGGPTGTAQAANQELLPGRITVRVSYTDGPENHQYKDSFLLDTKLLMWRTYAESSRAPEAQLKEINKGVGAVTKQLNRLTAAVTDSIPLRQRRKNAKARREIGELNNKWHRLLRYLPGARSG